MTGAKIVATGNHGRGYLGHGIDGVGTANVPTAFGWLAVSGDVGSTFVVQMGSLVKADINQGIYFQSAVSVDVDFTLCNPGLAASVDPANQASVIWSNTLSVAANGPIVQAPILFTAIRLTFHGKGVCYILAD